MSEVLRYAECTWQESKLGEIKFLQEKTVYSFGTTLDITCQKAFKHAFKLTSTTCRDFETWEVIKFGANLQQQRKIVVPS